MESFITAEKANLIAKTKELNSDRIKIIFNKIKEAADKGKFFTVIDLSQIELNTSEIQYLISLKYDVIYDSKAYIYRIEWY